MAESPKKGKFWRELNEAARTGDVHRISSALATGLDLNFTPATADWTSPPPPLLTASQKGQIEVVRVLVNHKNILVNIVYKKETPLSAAAKKGFTDIMKLLFEHGARADYVGHDPRVRMWTALMVAAQYGQSEAALLLLQHGANVDGDPSSLKGDTPLTLAARNGHAKVVNLLTDNGAVIHSSDPLSRVPLTEACRGGHTECALTLIQHGASVNEESQGYTPLTGAVEKGYTECTLLLLESGADVNQRNHWNYTPLMVASENGHIDNVRILLKHDADVNLVLPSSSGNTEGETALSLSRKHHLFEIAELLSKHGKEKTDMELDSEEHVEKGNVEDRKDDNGSENILKEEGLTEEHQKEADVKESGDEDKHLAAVDRAMKEKGELEHALAHGVLVGPARSGKSSLMSRLVGEMPSPNSPSTGAAEQGIQVGVKKSHSIALGVLDSIWFKLLYDEEAIRLVTLASHNIPFPQQYQRADKTTHHPQKQLSSVSLPTPPPREPDTTMNSVTTVSLPAGYVAPMGVFKAALRGRGLGGLRQHFENSWSFYLTDTGGQIEFQEVLPLLVSGPSVFFITFRLDQDLHQRFTIEYHLPDGGRSKPYPSTVTVVEAILHTIASIASMGTFTYQSAENETAPLKPKVFIVGTHKDKLDTETQDSDIKKIDQYLQGVIKSTSHYEEDLVEFATKYQMIYTVNNLSDDDTDFQKIRSGVERVVCRRQFKMKFPSHWLIFSLVLRQEMIKDSIITFEQCFAIAQDCGITDQEELGHALWFLHTKIGLIRHFPTPGLHDLVIRHPQILFDMVTKLIVNTFTFENVSKRRCTEFEKKGLFTLTGFKQIEQSSSSLLPPEKLLQLLEHLRIVAPFEEKGEKRYFLPCVLAHSEESKSPSSPQSSGVPPLLITFECGYCPKGLYGALIQSLLTNKAGSKFKWELMMDQIFRDQVTFDVSPYDTITLKFNPRYLEIVHSCTTKSIMKRTQSVEDICNKVRLSVEKCVEEVSSSMKLNLCAKHSLSFYCGHPDCSPKEPHPATKISEDDDGCFCNLCCKHSGKTLRSCLPASYSVWFGEERGQTEVDLHVSGAQGPHSSVQDQHTDHGSIDKSHTHPTTSTAAENVTGNITPGVEMGTIDFNPADQTPSDSQDFSATKCWGLESIHDTLNGTGVTIAVIDAGVNLAHKALKQTVKGKDFVQSAHKNTWRTQPSSHGTMVAFVAAGNKFTGIHQKTGTKLNVNCGVAPNATLIMCNVGEKYLMSGVSKALELLIDKKQKGTLKVDIVCMSFGVKNILEDGDQQRIKGLIKQLRDLNVIMVASAGNYGKYSDGVLFPACLSDVISVGALNYTGYERETNPPTNIDVYAPGEAIAHPSFDSTDGVSLSSGSSCATPAVAGLVGLLVENSRKYPTPNLKLDLDYVRTVLKREMKKKGDAILLDPREYFQDKLKDVEIERLKAALCNKK